MATSQDFQLGSNLVAELVESSVAEILASERFERLRAHVQSFLQDRMPGSGDIPKQALMSLEVLLATAVWNATPLPSNGFTPSPRPKPGRNDPCACGSGRKYKRCCAPLAADLPEMPTDDIWPIVVELLPLDQVQQLAQSGKLPPTALGSLARRCLEEDQPKRALALVEPIFNRSADRLARLDSRYEEALDTLIDAYDRLNYSRKKEKLLDRLGRQLRPPLRAAVWMRRAPIEADRGDWEQGWVYFASAQRDDPEHPALGSLEVTMLLSAGDQERAVSRAEFWLASLRRGGFDDYVGPAEFLREVIADPYRTMFVSGTPFLEQEVLGRFWDLVQCELALPVPRYEIEGSRRGSVLESPQEVARIEKGWQKLYGREGEILPIQSWFPDTARKWLRYLEQSPGALGSFIILRDVVLAAVQLPSQGAPWQTEGILRPLLERARTTAAEAWSRALASSQRPAPLFTDDAAEAALFLLKLGMDLSEELNSSTDEAVIRLMLELDPSDHHTVRPRLVVGRVRDGAYDEALTLIREASGPDLFSLQFGEALVLFALGESKAARHALEPVYREAPLIADFLTGRKKKRPNLDQRGDLSEAAVAWFEYQGMVEAWESVEGAIEWLRKTRAKIDAEDRAAVQGLPIRAPSRGRVSGICQIRIELLDIEPPIWRRVQLPYNGSFWDLHVAIQDAMGWTDSHLHQFSAFHQDSGEEVTIGIPVDDLEEFPVIAGWQQPIADLLDFEQSTIRYLYDFGDDWEHEIVLEMVGPRKAGTSYPRCIAGERACPPEDVGGVGGYAELVAAMRDPLHSERQSLMEWLGGPYDPERLDLAQIRFSDPQERWREVFQRDL